jgi:hypothetical protein
VRSPAVRSPWFFYLVLVYPADKIQGIAGLAYLDKGKYLEHPENPGLFLFRQALKIFYQLKNPIFDDIYPEILKYDIERKYT